MIGEVLKAVWIGAIIGAALKLLSPHPSLASWIISALVGGAGAMGGLFVARLLGVSRELPGTTFMVAGGVAAIAVVLYAALSRAILTRMLRRGRAHDSRPSIAF